MTESPEQETISIKGFPNQYRKCFDCRKLFKVKNLVCNIDYHYHCKKCSEKYESFLLVKFSEIEILMSYSKTITEKAETLQIIDSRSYRIPESELVRWMDAHKIRRQL